jgi:hypothetical protein
METIIITYLNTYKIYGYALYRQCVTCLKHSHKKQLNCLLKIF